MTEFELRLFCNIKISCPSGQTPHTTTTSSLYAGFSSSLVHNLATIREILPPTGKKNKLAASSSSSSYLNNLF